MADINFRVKEEALSVVRNTVIEANFDEVKAALTEMIEPYRTMVVQENDIPNAKNDRAKIRKVAGNIDDLRKTVKKAYSESLSAFEAKCKELVAICDDGAKNLDEQIKEYEERERAAKIERIRNYYDSVDGFDEERGYLPWEAIFDARWGNKGFSEDDAKDVIKSTLMATHDDLEFVRSFDEHDVPYLLDLYKDRRDTRLCMAKAKEFEARRIAEERRKAEEERARMEAEHARLERERLAQMERERKEAEAVYEEVEEEQPAVAVAPRYEDELLTIDFRATGTREQFRQLKVFMQSLGMRLGRVK